MSNKCRHSHGLNYVLEHPEKYSEEQIEHTKQTNKEFGELCEKLGVKRGCSFHVKLVNHKKATMGRYRELFRFTDEHEVCNRTYAFLHELVVMGDYDGWSQWYGGCDKVLQLIKEGVFVLNKEQTKKTSLV